MIYNIIYINLIFHNNLYKKRLKNLRVNLIKFAGMFKVLPVSNSKF